jgi:hypothetical protein
MKTSHYSDPVRGKTIRMSWTEGPAAGAMEEQIFHQDGTVERRSATDFGSNASGFTHGSAAGLLPPERPPYVGIKITYDVCLVSFLSRSGYTLTVALNFGDGSAVGFYSSEKESLTVKATFQVLH